MSWIVINTQQQTWTVKPQTDHAQERPKVPRVFIFMVQESTGQGRVEAYDRESTAWHLSFGLEIMECMNE